MNLEKYLKSHFGQTILEYTIVFAAVLLALLAADLVGRVRQSFTSFFAAARSAILGG